MQLFYTSRIANAVGDGEDKANEVSAKQHVSLTSATAERNKVSEVSAKQHALTSATTERNATWRITTTIISPSSTMKHNDRISL
jgi:hypothetical protein